MAKRKRKYRKPLKLDLKKGAFRSYVQRNYGKEGFTREGKIKISVARKIANDPNVSEKTRKRARFMLSARKWRKK